MQRVVAWILFFAVGIVGAIVFNIRDEHRIIEWDRRNCATHCVTP